MCCPFPFCAFSLPFSSISPSPQRTVSETHLSARQIRLSPLRYYSALVFLPTVSTHLFSFLLSHPTPYKGLHRSFTITNRPGIPHSGLLQASIAAILSSLLGCYQVALYGLGNCDHITSFPPRILFGCRRSSTRAFAASHPTSASPNSLTRPGLRPARGNASAFSRVSRVASVGRPFIRPVKQLPQWRRSNAFCIATIAVLTTVLCNEPTPLTAGWVFIGLRLSALCRVVPAETRRRRPDEDLLSMLQPIALLQRPPLTTY